MSSRTTDETPTKADCESFLRSGERIDDLLVNGLKIIQNPSAFCFGCDAVEIANFAKRSIHVQDGRIVSGTYEGKAVQS